MLLSLLLLIHDSHCVDHQSSDELFVFIQTIALNHFCFDWGGRGGVWLAWFVRFLCFFFHPLNLCKYAENPRTTNSFKSNGQKVKMALASLLVRHIAERRSSVYI